MFFDSWTSLLKIVIVGSLAYIALVALLRTSGKRTLAQMNAFDLIVTVALGSMLATVVISKDTALAEGVLGLTLLILFQYGVAWLSIRSPRFSKLVKSEPRLLLHKGKLLERALREERIKKEELLQAIRNQGVLSLDQVEAVVIETNGSFSIIKVAESKGLSTLASVKHTHEMNKAAE